ncbi:MAG: hypothetical protein JSR45_18080 [Proteobacteria bacterium]|nr:hypothetical protein [Pseudomonadota bacterium]
MALAVLAPVAASAATPLDLYYERTLMSTAQARCGLFTAPIGAALEASAAQARGAALRGGADMASVRATAAHAVAKIDEVGCNSADLRVAAQRVRTAFEAWTHVTRMTFPGEAAGWKADRTAYRSAQWKLVQPSKALGSPVQFGMAGRGSGSVLLTVAEFPDGARPYAARLVFRDALRAPNPWLGAPSSRPLPPRAASRAVMAQDKADADPMLAWGHAGAVAFRFPTEAADALGGLDPREQFAVEFLFPGDQIRTARFEVGDFAAGRAFLRLGGS